MRAGLSRAFVQAEGSSAVEFEQRKSAGLLKALAGGRWMSGAYTRRAGFRAVVGVWLHKTSAKLGPVTNIADFSAVGGLDLHEGGGKQIRESKRKITHEKAEGSRKPGCSNPRGRLGEPGKPSAPRDAARSTSATPTPSTDAKTPSSRHTASRSRSTAPASLRMPEIGRASCRERVSSKV